MFTSLTGCDTLPGMPGYLSVNKVDFDGAVELKANQAFVYRKAETFSGADMSMSIFWRSTMKPSTFIIEAFVDGTHSIPQKNSLQFNIDGSIISLDSIDTITKIKTKMEISKPINESSRRYEISENLLLKILDAKDVKVKFNLRGEYITGVFSYGITSSAKESFGKFYEKYKQLKSSTRD